MNTTTSFRQRLFAIVLFLACAAPAVAQTPAPNRIPIVAEYIPRDLDASAKLVVTGGQTVTLPAVGTYDYIEVQPGGTLRCDRAGTTQVKVTTFTIMAGGVFDCGTVEDPITGLVDITIRDVPFDFARDPFQWSHGLINFGKQTRVGADWQKTIFAEVAGDLAAGATRVSFQTPPSGWQVGDALLFPDMEMAPVVQNGRYRGLHRRESPVTIASLDASGMVLSKPLDFEHTAIKGTDGTVIARVRVANLTRSHIVIESENPKGVRGHTANIGQAAVWDLRGNTLKDLGRTQNTDLDVTTADANGAITHIGTNQIAKYNDHDHFTFSNTTGSRIRDGNVYLVGDGAKWGLSVHRTDDSIVRRTVVADAQGAGIVTEDGPEVRNMIHDNVVAYSRGTGKARGEAPDAEQNCPGCDGFGYWFRGPGQDIRGNEAWDNFIGFSMFNRAQLSGLVPSKPGGPLDTPMDPKAIPSSFDANVSIGGFHGMETWSMARFLVANSVFAHANDKQYWLVNSAPSGVSIGTWTKNVTLVGQRGRSICLTVDAGYTAYASDEGSRFLDCDLAVGSGITITTGIFKGTTFQGRSAALLFVGPQTPDTASDFTDVKFLSDANEPSIIVFGPKNFASGDYGRGFLYQDGSAKTRFVNWKGTGVTYRLLNILQRRDTPALYARDSFQSGYMAPECGATMGESWDKCGYAWGGEVYDESEVVHLDGVVNAVGKIDTPEVLGTPHAVLSVPSPLVPVKSGQTKMEVLFMLTGDPTKATPQAYWSLDGGSVGKSTSGEFGDPRSGRRRVTIDMPTGAGQHTIETWRVDKATGKEIPGSRLAFHFSVGTSTAPPVPQTPTTSR